MSFTPGARIGPYEILSPLGAGGMGEVWKARDTRLDRDVAIKTSHARFSERFAREARSIAALNHPQICQLYDVGPDYLVMEFVDGTPIAPVETPRQLLDIAVQLGDGLAAAHAAGIIHRDLKPDNILITREGRIKILDFGLAKAAATDAPPEEATRAITKPLTEPGAAIGTVAYMSPEQARGNVALTAQSDQFSLGLVLYELAAGQRAFQRGSAAETMTAIIREEAAPLPATVPAPLRWIVERLLAKDPSDRYDSTRDLYRELRQVRERLTETASGTAGAITGSTPGDRRTWTTTHSPARRLLTWAAAATLAVVVGFALWRLGTAFATSAPRVVRLSVSFPASQALVKTGATPIDISPDGTAIVYTGRGPKGSLLYYRRLDQLEGNALPGTDDSIGPRISPSGEWVAFYAGGRISKVSVRGGAPIFLADTTYRGGLCWGSDETIFFTDGNLRRVGADGGAVTQVAVAVQQPQSGFYMPMALPGGETVLVWHRYFPDGTQAAKETLAIVRVADGTVTDLDGDGMNPIGFLAEHLIFGRPDGTIGATPFDPVHTRSVRAVVPVLDAPWTRASGGMAAAVSAGGDLVYVRANDRLRLTFLDEQGHITGGSADERNFGTPRFSPDGRRIAFAELTENSLKSDIWLYDIAADVFLQLTRDGRSSSPEWTPDGRNILYTDSPATSGPREAWVAPTDGSGPPERLLAMSIPVALIVPSPDSRYAVVAATDPTTNSDLYLVDLKGDRTPQPLLHSAFAETSPRVSPDGHWLAYVTNENGQTEVYVRPFPTGAARVQVSVNGGSLPRWTRDGRGIVYRNRDVFTKAHLAVGATVTVTRRDALFSGTYSGSYDVASDGTIVALRPTATDADVMVVLNWVAELKPKPRGQ